MQDHNQQEDFQARATLYALGALSQAETQAFEDELALASDTARVEVAELEAVVAQIGLSVDEATPSISVRAQLLAQIAPAAQTVAAPNLTPAAAHLDIFSNEGQWINLFAGVSYKTLFTEPSNGYITTLMKFAPGASLPNHHHKGNEQCLIVAGEFKMNNKTYIAGDFTVALDGSDHLNFMTETGGTVLLVSPPDYELLRI